MRPRVRLLTLRLPPRRRAEARIVRVSKADSPGSAKHSALPEVVAVLVENYRRFLAFVERWVGSREVAEDILQEAFVRGLARTGQVRAQDSVVAWFYRSLRNAMIDDRGRSSSERRIFDDAASETDIEAPVDPELMTTVCTCVTALLEATPRSSSRWM